jgi:hypothetical protein
LGGTGRSRVESMQWKVSRAPSPHDRSRVNCVQSRSPIAASQLPSQHQRGGEFEVGDWRRSAPAHGTCTAAPTADAPRMPAGGRWRRSHSHKPASHYYLREWPADPQGGWGLLPPYCWCINGNMGRVREKKRWKKEEKMER